VGLPADHPLRLELNDEVHARPPLPLRAPARVTCLALLSPPSAREQEWQLLRELAAEFGVELPPTAAPHCTMDLGPFRLKWERHTEFSRYVFAIEGTAGASFGRSALDDLPHGWLARLPGAVLFAAQVALVPDAQRGPVDTDRLSAVYFGGQQLVGSVIGGGSAVALTDFRVGDDGFVRMLVLDRGMKPNQAGRAVQALLEIDGYRMLALLAFPMARELSPALGRDERELAEIARVLVAAEPRTEPELLDRLTRLQAGIERHEADHHYRFGAAEAYHAIVLRRIAQLREERVGALQTFDEFIERRVGPAMSTCVATSERLESLSSRVARASQLLSTRIEMTRERQNQALLESMTQRAEAQLRLQQTVEGLSVAAITYYVAGLLNYVAKGLQDSGLPIDPTVATAVGVPVVAVLVWLAIRRVRRSVSVGAGSRE
jgi:uncharacterized membrane-anchored protein